MFYPHFVPHNPLVLGSNKGKVKMLEHDTEHLSSNEEDMYSTNLTPIDDEFSVLIIMTSKVKKDIKKVNEPHHLVCLQ